MNWYEKTEKIPFDKLKFKTILEFYLFNCPVASKTKGRISKRGKTFGERGITGQKLTRLLRDMKNEASSMHYHVGKRHENLEEYVKNNDMRDNNDIIVFIEDEDIKKTQSIFYYIRNAFAHGSFSVKNKVYYFTCEKKECKALFRINENTLIEWIKLIERYSK